MVKMDVRHVTDGIVIKENHFQELMKTIKKDLDEINEEMTKEGPETTEAKKEWLFKYFESSAKHQKHTMKAYEEALVKTVVPEKLRHLLFVEPNHYLGGRELSKYFFQVFESEYKVFDTARFQPISRL